MHISFLVFRIAIAFALPAITLAGKTIELAVGTGGQQPRQPQVAVVGKEAIHVVFGIENEIRYRRSDDGSKSFAEPVTLPAVHAMSLGMRRGPRIAVTDSAICVTAIGGKQGKGSDGDLLALRSTDGGKTRSEPVAVNDKADAAREGLHAMAAVPKGSLSCVWLDLRNDETEVMASSSTDGVKTWSKNTLVYRSPDGSVCECCHPCVAIDQQGRIFVQWRNSLAGSRPLCCVIGRWRQDFWQGEQARQRIVASESLPNGLRLNCGWRNGKGSDGMAAREGRVSVAEWEIIGAPSWRWQAAVGFVDGRCAFRVVA